MKKAIKFDLINNARSSLNHAVEHLANPDGINSGDLKYAIRDIAHVVELLLKERLRRIHEAFIWQNIDKYPSSGAYKVGTNIAVERLFKLGGIKLAEEAKKTISACRDFRNLVEHYEFEINLKETKGIIGRMLSFIFDFSKKHLQLDLEKEFRNDDRWVALIDIYEFWEAHSNLLEKQLVEEGKVTICCPSCDAMTFDIDSEKCLLCGHVESLVDCDVCHESVLESETEVVNEFDYDEEGPTGEAQFTICKRNLSASLTSSRLHDYF